jgi:RNA-directed DNA polymerase
VPTVADRVGQGVVKSYLEAIVEPKFHEDSYGYRPGKSAIEAVGVARKRCWGEDWIIDLDIRQFFDSIDHELIMKAVRYHTKERWIELYVERWLKAPLQLESGEVIARDRGTPQGGVVSPLLANIFMHHAFDDWMRRNYPEVKFERYADDIIVHCRSKQEAEKLLEAIRGRLEECKLSLHPEKTKVVYCKDANRRGTEEKESFDFLGYTFRPRLAINKWGKGFVNFTPAISNEAAKSIRKEVKDWKIHLKNDKSLSDIAGMINKQAQGWINYYGCYYKTALYPIVDTIERRLVRWVMKKYKRFKGRPRQARNWLRGIREREPSLFAHWRLGLGSEVG